MTIGNYLKKKIERSVAQSEALAELAERIESVEATNEEQDAALVELAGMIGGVEGG